MKVRKAKRAAMTNRAIELNLEKLPSLAEKSGLSIADYLKEIICRGWQAFYEIKNFEQPKTATKNTATTTQQEQEKDKWDKLLGKTGWV